MTCRTSEGAPPQAIQAPPFARCGGNTNKSASCPLGFAQCANHGSGLVLRDHPLRSLRSGVERQQILAEARPFSNSCFAFDLVITHRTPIQRFWPIRIAGQLRSRPSRRQLLSLLPVEFVEAPTFHLRVEHFQGAAAGVDLIAMGEIWEAFENAPRRFQGNTIGMARAERPFGSIRKSRCLWCL